MMKCGVCGRRITGKAKLEARLKIGDPKIKAYCGCLGRKDKYIKMFRARATRTEQYMRKYIKQTW